jgi:hypothetical protein
MGRQFQLYLLPEDAESLIAELQSRVGLRLLCEDSPSAAPVETDTPVSESISKAGDLVHSCRCYLAPPWVSKIKMHPKRAELLWHVDQESEVIEFSGCHLRGNLLVRGRFYYQPEFVAGNAFVAKSEEFLTWAEKVFRTAKKLLHKQPGVIYAYVGDGAQRWRTQGGRFAHLIKANGEPMYDDPAV